MNGKSTGKKKSTGRKSADSTIVPTSAPSKISSNDILIGDVLESVLAFPPSTFFSFSEHAVKKTKPVAKKKRVMCPSCGGSGWLYCENCRGSGEEVCPDCDGSGDLLCPSCGGSGDDEVSHVGYWLRFRCFTCGGRRIVPCDCKDGMVNCKECNGKRGFVCDRCRGKGKILKTIIPKKPVAHGKAKSVKSALNSGKTSKKATSRAKKTNTTRR